MLTARSIQGIITLAFALFTALWLGVSIVTNQAETIMQVAGVSLLVVSALLGQRIWLLYIAFSALSVPIIRGIGTDELGQMLMIAFCSLLFLMRRLRIHWRFNELDLWRLILALCIIQVYLRNPVGLNLFGAGAVGARPYFETAIALISGFVLSKLAVPPGEIKWAMGLTFIGSILASPLGILRGTGAEVSVGGVDKVGDGVAGPAAGRAVFLRPVAITLAQFVSSRISPLRAILHPIWAPLILLSLAFAAASGYRSVVANVGLIYLAAIAYRGGVFSMLIAATGGALTLGVLALLNLAYPLPANVQRALSPFPGTWEERYVENAETSTDWRVEMWKEALFTDYWIENKILGDGLGLTRLEYQRIQAMEDQMNYRASSGLTVQQEAMMVTGGYHSGPVQTIRTIGYAGLVLLLLALIRIAVHAHRMIRRCRNTEWYVVALFFCIPLVVYPAFFTFIFGTFDQAVKVIFLGSGILSLMQNNLPLSDQEGTTEGQMMIGRIAPDSRPLPQLGKSR